jgi:hypothetical protein
VEPAPAHSAEPEAWAAVVPTAARTDDSVVVACAVVPVELALAHSAGPEAWVAVVPPAARTCDSAAAECAVAPAEFATAAAGSFAALPDAARHWVHVAPDCWRPGA